MFTQLNTCKLSHSTLLANFEDYVGLNAMTKYKTEELDHVNNHI